MRERSPRRRGGPAARAGVRAGRLPALLLLLPLIAAATDEPAPSPPPPAAPSAEIPPAELPPAELSDIIVEAPEPRYVAPTLRDRIGRIWAPVMINGKGPFRLVLDTGANHSAVTAAVAAALGIPPSTANQVRLLGVTGARTVATIPVDSLVVGELELHSKRLPILTDALGGADGVLGTEGLQDKRIYIDFRHDLIRILRSHREEAPPGFVTVPVRLSGGMLLLTDVRIGFVRVQAIIDTGAQATLANVALRDALVKRVRPEDIHTDEITGATLDVQVGDRLLTPPINISGLSIRGAHITVGDMYIFHQWRMIDEPTLLIGMDVLGLLDTLIIDYKRGEVFMRRSTGRR